MTGNTPILTIAVQCHHFQKRLLWMLSSLAQQTFPQLIAVDVASFQPMTQHVVSRFPFAKLTHWYEFDKFEKRGLVRNRQLKECATSWLMFSDCDMVYHPTYIERLCAELLNKHPDAPYMLGSGRMSTTKADGNALVEKEPTTAWESASVLPLKEMVNVGAGYCQIINVANCPHDGYYIRRRCNLDVPLTSTSNFNSDWQFRRRVSRNGNKWKKLPDWFTQNAIHINHERDLDAGRHVTDQR